MVQGHGVRERQLWGPAEPGGQPLFRVLALRRYRCKRCRAVTTVGPAELLSRRLYTASAIAWALALFSLARMSPKALRALVSPLTRVGATAAARWVTVGRWCAAAAGARLFACVGPLPSTWSARQVAERAATTVATYALPAPEPPPLVALVFSGAARAP